MKYTILSILLLVLLYPCADAQVLKGNIRNQSGEPVQYATVFIKELRQGTTANAKGDYEIRLSEGVYQVTYQSLGFEPVIVNIKISSGEVIIRDVVLPLQYYQIPEVRITASGEDPAYIIMRKVIGMAPYYLNNVKYYKAEVYLKGNLVVNRIPRLLRKQIEKDEDISIREGDTYFMESYNEIEFTAPDKYHQRVISVNSTFPAEGNEISPMEFIQASFYEPEIAEMAISPLSPAAFSHYNFRYTGLSIQGEFTINKIQVIPKRKSQQLFEGTIFIIEDLWCLHSVDLVNENLAGRIRVQQLYVPVQDDIWMPVSHKFDVNISIVGVKADAFYGSSVRYLDVKPNLALKKPETITVNYNARQTTAPDTAGKTKTEEQINKILSKDELNNRDMVRLSRLMDKKAENTQADSARKSLEITDKTIQEIDKDAGKKDSAFWAQIRPIPLSDKEKISMRVSDSLKAKQAVRTVRRDSAAGQQEQKKPNKLRNTASHIAFGNTWSDTTGNRFRFGGLIDPGQITFNTVDGFVYGAKLGYTRYWKKHVLNINPQLKWAFGREKLIWTLNSSFVLNRNTGSQVYTRAGQASVDFNTGGGINLFLNSSLTLLLRRNYLKLYESGYFTLGYMTRITPGVSVDFSGTYEDRGILENNTDFSIFRPARDFTENIPVNEYLLPGANPGYALRNMRHGELNAVVTWTPFTRYRVSGETKIPQGSDWPTFSIAWKHGINEPVNVTDPLKHFDMIRFEASERMDIAAFSEFRWRLRTGGIVNKRHITFYDFYHINSQPLPLLFNNYHDAFMLPDFYSLSTPEFYIQAHTKYTTPYLLLKYLPFISNTLIRENLSLSYLWSVDHPHYYEIGYSLSEIFFLAELGVYAGFENFSYRSAGVSLTLKFN